MSGRSGLRVGRRAPGPALRLVVRRRRRVLADCAPAMRDTHPCRSTVTTCGQGARPLRARVAAGGAAVPAADVAPLGGGQRSRAARRQPGMGRAGAVAVESTSGGPRHQIFFEPAKLRCGIVTCGGLCPGINNVVRGLVLELTHAYGVEEIFGFRYGFEGLVARHGHKPMRARPAQVAGDPPRGGHRARHVARRPGPARDGRPAGGARDRRAVRDRRRRHAARRDDASSPRWSGASCRSR